MILACAVAKGLALFQAAATILHFGHVMPHRYCCPNFVAPLTLGRLPQIERHGQTRNLRKGNAVATYLHRSVRTDHLHAPAPDARSLRDDAPDELALLLTTFACETPQQGYRYIGDGDLFPLGRFDRLPVRRKPEHE